MKSSRIQSGNQPPIASPAKSDPTFSGNRQVGLFGASSPALSGSYNDAAMIRSLVTDSMKNCQLSRLQIAEEMSRLTGTSVTERQLNNFAADSREEYRFPSELERAFCEATGDYRLLTCRADLAGFHVIDARQMQLLILGREYLRQKRAASAVASLENELAGVEL